MTTHDRRPTFDQVYECLQRHGLAHVVSSRGMTYMVTAEIRGGRRTVVGSPREGEVRVHDDCWGQDMTCERTLAGGIFNGDPSIYDWYHQLCGQ